MVADLGWVDNDLDCSPIMPFCYAITFQNDPATLRQAGRV